MDSGKSLILAIVTSLIIVTSGLAAIAVLNAALSPTAVLPAAFAQQQHAATAPETGGQGSDDNGTAALYGIISSKQTSDAGAPMWLSVGSWKLVTDRPIFGGNNNQTRPTVKSFDATVEMMLISNGTRFHTHHIYDFKQSDVLLSESNNSTIFNGTMTVASEKGAMKNVPGFLIFQDNVMSIWVDPGKIGNHFGPTPLHGMIVSPQRLEQLGGQLPQ